MRKITLVLLFAPAMLASCLPVNNSPTQSVDQIVQATFEAMTAQAGVDPAQNADLPGSISGGLGYPAEGLPAMRLAAFNVDTNEAYYVDTQLNQRTYQIQNIPPGTYHVVAYSLGGGAFPPGLVGGHTQYIVCEAQADCTDHSFAPVLVESGKDTSDINTGDFPLAEDTYPPMPGEQPTLIEGPPALDPEGVILGNLSYPSSFIPPQLVVAYRVDGPPGEYRTILTVEGQSTFEMRLPQGTYQVVAYALDENGRPGSLAGGYTQAVPCGLTISCTDHTLITIPVVAGGATEGIDPGDWYATEGTFPPAPTLP